MRYRPYSEYLKEKYGEKVYKLPINLPITCPNKDGTCGVGGCIYCADIGAAFENLPPEMPEEEQLKEEQLKDRLRKKEKKDIHLQTLCLKPSKTEL